MPRALPSTRRGLLLKLLVALGSGFRAYFVEQVLLRGFENGTLGSFERDSTSSHDFGFGAPGLKV